MMTAAQIEARAASLKQAATGVIPMIRSVLTGGNDRARSQRNAAIAFLVRCISALLLYVSQIAIARWMGSAEYGIYVFVWTCVLMAGALSHLGLGLGIIRLIPVHREAGEFDLLRGLIHGGRAFALAAGTLVALAGMAGLWLFEPYVSSSYRLAAYLALVCIPLYALTDVQDGIGRGNGWMSAALIPPYVLRPLLLLVCMTLAYALGLRMVATTAAFAAIIATWATGIVQALWINRAMVAEYGRGARAYRPKVWMTSSLPLLAISGCEILLQNTDIIVLSRYMTPTDVGIYFAAGKTMSLIMFVHYAVGSAMASRFASYSARGDKDGLRDAVREAVNWTFWPSLATAVVILLLGKPLLSLFGPQFVSGYPVMAILVFGFLARSAMGPAEFLLNMQGEQRACAVVMMASAAMNILLNIILVPRLGLMGAAIATAVSLTMAAGLNAAVARWRLGIDVAIWRNLRKKS
ncbi:MAG: lipopolysaccharide biosynthesis protein [Hyphomicrobiaceae bacterium]